MDVAERMQRRESLDHLPADHQGALQRQPPPRSLVDDVLNVGAKQLHNQVGVCVVVPGLVVLESRRRYLDEADGTAGSEQGAVDVPLDLEFSGRFLFADLDCELPSLSVLGEVHCAERSLLELEHHLVLACQLYLTDLK